MDQTLKAAFESDDHQIEKALVRFADFLSEAAEAPKKDCCVYLYKTMLIKWWPTIKKRNADTAPQKRLDAARLTEKEKARLKALIGL